MRRNLLRAGFPALALALALAAAACAGETPSAPEVTEPVVGGPVSFQIVDGNEQTGPVGEELPKPLIVRALDAAGHPVPGRQIALVVVAGGGRMYVGGGVTDALGYVQDYWTLGTSTADSQRVEARTVDPVTGQKQMLGRFQATAVGGLPAATVPLTDMPPSGWSGPVRSVIADSMRVAVVDRYGNRVRQAGLNVHWVASHGGNVSTSNGIVPTDAQGVSTTTWQLGTVAGPQTLSTFVSGTSPATHYHANAFAGPPASVAFSADSIFVNSLQADVPYAVSATDAYGNPVSYSLFSTNSSIVSVGPNNTLTSRANGTARVTAVAGSVSDTVVVVVQQRAAVIQFRAMPSTVKVGGTLPMDWYTVLRDANNQVMPNISGQWTSTNPTVASVSAGGTVTAHTTGTFKIIVSRDGVTRETATITVVP
jgi:hypothetical protein